MRLRDALAHLPYRMASDLAIRIDETTVRAADIAVYRADLPTDRIPDGKDILLAIEIADTTLSRDLGIKLGDYGRAGVASYWVVDAATRTVHVMRAPTTEGFAVREVMRFDEPLAVPGTDATITID